MGKFESVILTYEGSQYEVCVGMQVEEVDEIKPLSLDGDLCPIMSLDVIDWMLEQALEEIQREQTEKPFLDMNRREREIYEGNE